MPRVNLLTLFTAYPLPGKSFYVGSPEVFNKPLTELSLHIKHTKERIVSTSPPSDDAIYNVSILEQKSWNALNYEGDLFSETTLSIDMLHSRYPIEGNTKTARKPISFFDKVDEKTLKGFVQLEWAARNAQGNNFAAAVAVNTDWQALAITFQIKDISMSYASELRNLDQDTDQFFHVYPFGAIETYTVPYIPSPPDNYLYKTAGTNIVQLSGTGLPSFEDLDRKRGMLLVDACERLMPHFTYKSVYEGYGKSVLLNQSRSKAKAGGTYLNAMKTGAINGLSTALQSLSENNQYSGSIQEEGMLFIGLENAKPLQTLSMLFQFAEGSAEDEDNDPPVINWSYLTHNEWRPMRGEDLISDGTYGFQTTGIMKINIPADATNNNTIITSGLHWLCASVTRDANRIPMLIDIRTQAVTVTFKDNHNDASHFDTPLTAGSITKLSTAVAEVKQGRATLLQLRWQA